MKAFIKSFIAFALVLCMIFSFVACDDSSVTVETANVTIGVSVNPSDEVKNAKNGDVYFNRDTKDVYVYSSNGWDFLYNTAGRDSFDGTKWLTGNSSPTNSIGREGDFYLDKSSFTLYMVSNGQWEEIGSIKGHDGQDGQNGQGNRWFTGEGAPSVTGASDGDFYLDTTTFYVYNLKQGIWEMIGTIKGQDGVDGKNGQDGTNGLNGADGKDGTNGKDGKDGSNALVDASTLKIGDDGYLYINNVKTQMCVYMPINEQSLAGNYKTAQGSFMTERTDRCKITLTKRVKRGVKITLNNTNYRFGIATSDSPNNPGWTWDSDSLWQGTASGVYTWTCDGVDRQTGAVHEYFYLTINVAHPTDATIGATPEERENIFKAFSIEGYFENFFFPGTSAETGAAPDYNYSVNGVNHRGFSLEAPENTLAAYRLSKLKGFNAVETDVSFTRDGVPVLLHDDSIDRTSNGTGKIKDLTWDQIKDLDFSNGKTAYAGEKIPKFYDFLILCKNLGLHPYIELKTYDMDRNKVNTIVDMVKRVGMKGKVSYISFGFDLLEYVRDRDNTARLGYLIDGNRQNTLQEINKAISLKTDKNEVFIDANYYPLRDNVNTGNNLEDCINACIALDFALEVWTVDSADDIRKMDPFISGVTSNNLNAGEVLYFKSRV